MIKIAFSFDDGRQDNYRAAKEIFIPLNMKCSFNITIGYVLEKIDSNDKPSEHKNMSLKELKELYNNDLFEIAGHGYKHNNDISNLFEGNKVLKEYLNDTENKIVGIVSPHSQFETQFVDEFKKMSDSNGVKYLRVSHNFKKFSFIKKIIRKVNRKINSPRLFNYIYKDSDVKENDFLVHSVGIIKDNTLDEIKYLVEQAIKNNKNYVFMFHSILKPGEDFYNDLFTWDYDKFYELCSYLKQLEKDNYIEICKVDEII